MVKTCVTCSGPITSHGRDTKQCGGCFAAARMFCLTCGIELDKGNQTPRNCRACWLKAHPARPCVVCGNPLPMGSPKANRRCGACRKAAVRSCTDCGQPMPHASKGERCWECHMKIRAAAVVHGCSIEGCERPHRAKGMCMTHYLTVTRQQQGLPTGRSARPKAWIGSHPCAACGYSAMRSDVHRVIPGKNGGTYVLGNMVPLCARCHAEVHRGITPCPEPITELVVH